MSDAQGQDAQGQKAASEAASAEASGKAGESTAGHPQAFLQHGIPTQLPPGQYGLYFNPATDQIVEKLTERQIDTILKNNDIELSRHHIRQLVFVPLAIVGLLAFCWMFLHFQKADLLETVLKLMIGFVAGALGGYGYAKQKAGHLEE